MWLGVALLIANFWFLITFVLAYWIYYERIMFAEEQFLRSKFGITYMEWANRVPAFIPIFNLKKFVKPQFAFSWKKVLKKEKNGLAATFLIFAFFDILGELKEGKVYFDYTLLASCLLIGLLYVILKYFKTYTNLLNERDR